MERIALIDVSSEDDLLISSSTEGLPPMIQSFEKCDGNQCDGLSEFDSTVEEENPEKVCQQMEQAPIFSGSPEPKRGTSCKYNLRKSLAWDSAFFTSEGVLDPEELAVVNSTFKKTEVHVLPGIQEDTRRSTESSSTLNSDSWALESLEADMFDHLRVSIQKSQEKRNEASTLSQSSKTTASGKLDAPGIHSSRHVQLSSKNKIKPPTASRRPDGSKQCIKQITEVAHQPVVKAAPGAVNQKSLLKPPRIASRTPTAPNKKISAQGSLQTKSNFGKTLPGDVGSSQCNVGSRKLNRVDTCSVTSRCSPSLKNCPVSASPSRVLPASSSRVSPTSSSRVSPAPSSRVLPASSSSSFSKSGSTLDNHTSKPHREVLRRKFDARNVEHLSDSADKVSLRILKSKNGLRNAKLPLSSPFKLSSSTTPTSSIDSMVSASSSTCSTARKPNSTTETIDFRCSSSRLLASSGSDVLQPPDILEPENEQSVIRSGTTDTVVKTQHKGQASTGNYVLLESAPDLFRNSINGNSGLGTFKPSCLRMPTPNVGYFDAEKTLVRNSNRCTPRGSQVSLNRSASKISNAGALKPKSSKFESAITGKCNSQHNDPQQISPRKGSMPPASVQVSETSPKVTRTPITVEKYHDRSTVGDYCPKGPTTNENSSEVEPAVTSECGWSSNLSVYEHIDQHCLSLETAISCFNQSNEPMVSANGSCDGTLRFAEASQIGKETTAAHYSSNMENKSSSAPKLDEKENLLPSANQIIDLNRNLEFKNLSVIMADLAAKKLSSLSLFDVDDSGNGSNLKLLPHPCDFISEDKIMLSSPINVDFSPPARTSLADD